MPKIQLPPISHEADTPHPVLGGGAGPYSVQLLSDPGGLSQFGAFIDLGVHQDGLVHVSQLSHKFVNDAREVVKTGDIVKVKVVEVDVPRKRIGLTMKLDAPTGRRDSAPRDNRFEPARAQRGSGRQESAAPSAMASAFARLQGQQKH